MATFGTVCDGIGCGHLAFNRAGFDCAWSAEIEPFPCAVLEERFPGVVNHGDMTMTAGLVERGEIAAPDVFIGGTPCQAFSVAGKRKGLSDARGNLSLTFCDIADAIDDVRRGDGKPPCVVLWENVPGVLSDSGNAFGCFLGELSGSVCELVAAGDGWGNAGCVFGPKRTVAWRVLDSQFFGVAQRRRRVFVVASAGDVCRPEEILFEREGVRRDSAPSRAAGQGATYDVAPSLTSSGRGVERAGETRGQDPVVAVQKWPPEIASTLDAHYGDKQGLEDQHVNGGCALFVPAIAIQDVRGVDKAQNGRGYNADGTAYTVDAMATQGVAIGFNGDQSEKARSMGEREGQAPCLRTDGPAHVATASSVRRLTPVECERLQGLPDGWTQIARGNKTASECPDGPRYKGIGNGQTVNVMEWLARRIKAHMP